MSEMRDRIAEAIAFAANADYWVDEIEAWDNLEQWERDAHPDEYPSIAYEDRAWYREQADAVLKVVSDDKS